MHSVTICDKITETNWASPGRLGGIEMSLLTELSEDRRYILKVKETGKNSDQQLDDAAIAILRKVIAPTFRQMHYGGSYRTEKCLEILVDFSKEKSFTITPKPSWNFSHRGVDYSKKCNYSYTEDLPKRALWMRVALMASKEEWRINVNFERIDNQQLNFTLNLED